jgi:hypothetical protein
MAKPEEKQPEPPKAPEQTITITPSILKSLIKDGVAEILGSKSHDESMAERMRAMRGQDRPLPPEELIACRSPITGATMKARVIFSRSTPGGRIVEMLDYVRPEAAERHVDDGGLYSGQREWMRPHEMGKPLDRGQHKYRHWLYSDFWAKDWTALSGKPASFLAQWRVTQTADKAAE